MAVIAAVCDMFNPNHPVMFETSVGGFYNWKSNVSNATVKTSSYVSFSTMPAAIMMPATTTADMNPIAPKCFLHGVPSSILSRSASPNVRLAPSASCQSGRNWYRIGRTKAKRKTRSLSAQPLTRRHTGRHGNNHIECSWMDSHATSFLELCRRGDVIH